MVCDGQLLVDPEMNRNATTPCCKTYFVSSTPKKVL